MNPLSSCLMIHISKEQGIFTICSTLHQSEAASCAATPREAQHGPKTPDYTCVDTKIKLRLFLHRAHRRHSTKVELEIVWCAPNVFHKLCTALIRSLVQVQLVARDLPLVACERITKLNSCNHYCI